MPAAAAFAPTALRQRSRYRLYNGPRTGDGFGEGYDDRRQSQFGLADVPFAPTALRQPSRFRLADGPTTGDGFREGYDNRPISPFGIDEFSSPPDLGQIDQAVQNLARSTGILNQVQKLANAAIQEVTFKSTLTGTITFKQPLAPGDPAPAPVVEGNPFSQMIAKFAQPAIYVKTPAGTIPYEPYGEPIEDYSPLIVVGAVVGASLLTIAGIKVAQKLLK